MDSSEKSDTAKAEEPQAIQVLRLIFETIWTLVLINVEVLKSVFRLFVAREPKDVSGDVVLITGTGHGIGRELALRFSRLGATLVCVDINPKGNEETYNMIQQEKGKVFRYECDVTDRAAVFSLAEKVTREVGDVNILVNNAGILACNPVLSQTEKEIRLMNDVNINAHLWTIQAFLPTMIQNNNGHIVALSSMAGLMGLRNLVPYCGSKFAVRGMMEALEVEIHDDPRGLNGIKFTTIFPHIVNTGLCKKPRVRFPKLMNIVEVDDAADMIVDAVRRELNEQSLPPYFHYLSRYLYRVLPFDAMKIFSDYINVGVDPHG